MTHSAPRLVGGLRRIACSVVRRRNRLASRKERRWGPRRSKR